MCSWIYITTHSTPREGWWKWWTKMAANLNVFKSYKKMNVFHIWNSFFTEVHSLIHTTALLAIFSRQKHLVFCKHSARVLSNSSCYSHKKRSWFQLLNFIILPRVNVFKNMRRVCSLFFFSCVTRPCLVPFPFKASRLISREKQTASSLYYRILVCFCLHVILKA